MSPSVDRRLVPFLRLAGAAAAPTYALGIALFVVLRLDPVARLDRDLTFDLHRWALDRPPTATAARWLTHLGDPPLLTLAVAVVGIALLVAGRAHAARWLVAVTGLGALTELAVKWTVQAARPDLDTALLSPHGPSFPSDHAINSLVVTAALLSAVAAPPTERRPTESLRRLPGRRPVGWIVTVAMAVGVVVGLTRVLLGVHFVTDIVAGVALGLTWTFLAALVARHPTPLVDRAVERDRRPVRL